MPDRLLKEITSHYLESGDFNGLTFAATCGSEVIAKLANLVESRSIDVITDFDDDNTHVKRYHPPRAFFQLRNLRTGKLGQQFCAYPTARTLELSGVLDDPNEPYMSALRRGEPQLNVRAFSMGMLQVFEDSEDYVCEVGEDGGWIWWDLDGPSNCDVEIRADAEGTRYLTAYLVYLSRLSPAQQKIWAQYEEAPKFLGLQAQLIPAWDR